MTLLEQFAENGLIRLIPRTADARTGELFEEEGYTPWDGEYNDTNSNDLYEEDDYYADEDDRDDDYDNEFTFKPIFQNTNDERPDSMYDLKTMFECDDMSNEEFNRLSPADLFGITNAQLKFLNLDLLLTVSLSRFAELMKNKKMVKNIPDVQQRIKYVTLCLASHIDVIELPAFTHVHENFRPKPYTNKDKEKLEKYVKNIIFSHTEEESIEIIQLLKDYYCMYEYGYLQNNQRKDDGESLVNYELFPKPSHLKDMHDKAMRDMRTVRARSDANRRAEYDRMISQLIKTGPYKHFLKKGKDFSIIAATCCEDLKKEGNALNHCVYEYCCSFAEGKSFIYFLRENSNIEKPYFTLEIGQDLYDDNDHKYYLKQCFTYDDNTEKSPECENFIIDWANEKHLIIRCGL